MTGFGILNVRGGGLGSSLGLLWASTGKARKRRVIATAVMI
jgi:hypothetical protein